MAIPRSSIEKLIHEIAADSAKLYLIADGEEACVDRYIEISEKLRKKFEEKVEIDETK